MARVPMLRKLKEEPVPRLYTTPTTERGRPAFLVHVDGGPYSLLVRETEARALTDGQAYLGCHYQYDTGLGVWRKREP